MDLLFQRMGAMTLALSLHSLSFSIKPSKPKETCDGVGIMEIVDGVN